MASGLEESIAVLDISSMRPDIQEAKGTPSSIKSKLVYRDEEELDTGIQKVQPLPFLDEEIEKYHTQIRDSVEGGRKHNDDVPSEVLQRVDRAMSLAKTGQTSLFKASQLLEFTFEAYQYARLSSQDQFDLKRQCSRHVADFEEAFRSTIELRIKAEMDASDMEFEKSQSFLGMAVEEARNDVKSQEGRATDEDSIISNDSLKETHEQVQDMVRLERSELNLIGEQCVKDIKTIDEGLAELQQCMLHAKQQYEQIDHQRKQQLDRNRSEQRQLEERLRKLKAEEKQLVSDGETGLRLQQDADQAQALAEKEVQEWKEKIVSLKNRTDTSLNVMSCMEECTDLIMADAKRKKTHWKARLDHLALESLWALRESLLTKGAAAMMVHEDNKKNAKECERLVQQYEKEKKEAARNNFQIRVDELKRNIATYKSAKESHDRKVEESSQLVREIRTELGSLDERIQALRPGVKLDTVENRYHEQKRMVEEAFKVESTAGISFTLFHQFQQ